MRFQAEKFSDDQIAILRRAPRDARAQCCLRQSVAPRERSKGAASFANFAFDVLGVPVGIHTSHRIKSVETYLTSYNSSQQI